MIFGDKIIEITDHDIYNNWIENNKNCHIISYHIIYLESVRKVWIESNKNCHDLKCWEFYSMYIYWCFSKFLVLHHIPLTIFYPSSDA